MLLYHLTNVHHLVEIEDDGFIEVTESNIGAPLAVNGEYLPAMVGVILESEDEDTLSDSDPRNPDWTPTCMPAEIYRQMYEDGSAPNMIEPAEFSNLLTKHPSYHSIDGRPSVGMKVVVGYDPDDKGRASFATNDIDVDEVVAGMDKAKFQFGEHVGPDVVWLTRNPTPRQHWQNLNGAVAPYIFRKHAVLFTVEVPDEHVLKWSDWARDQNILEWWYDTLDLTGGGEADNWYVVPRRIPREEWVSIHNTEIGSVYWTQEQGHLEGDDRFSVPLPQFWVHSPLSRVV